jgi:hypothetical protein
VSLSAPTAGPFHILNDLLTFGETRGIRFLLRYRYRQQKADRHSEGTGNLLMESDGAFAFPRFELREVPLGNTNPHNQFSLCHCTPLAQHPDWIPTSRQPIDNGLGQHDLIAGCERCACTAHDSGCAGILTNRQRGQPLVFTPREDGKFLPPRSLDELNLSHDGPSIVDFASVADGRDDDGASIDVKNDAPVAYPQSRASTSLEALYVALPGLRERSKSCIEPRSHVGGESEPLTGGRSGKDDLHQVPYITECDILVKTYIAYRNIEASPQ